ncbi:lysine--tRNA ligase, partial [Candidatus Woesearchaeota archaeon]|nr:lysine--tRNA ligase [Candidatus Woesearchaeota archaeon]
MSDIKESMHWADVTAERIISQKGDRDSYVCAAGITPSGVVHIGNFREIITVDLVVRALRKIGKNVRFIYSWDDYDVFRKVPKNMPQQDMLKENLRKAIVDVPDPFGTQESYARHHEVDVENDIHKVGIKPEFLYQAKKYRNLEYVEGIKKALQNANRIREILNEHREEPLDENWLPISGYCPECGDDRVDLNNYDGEYNLNLKCNNCSCEKQININESPFLKLPWRIDWPMRW